MFGKRPHRTIKGILVGGVLEVLKNLVIPAVAQKVGFSWSLKDDLKKLQDNLEIIHAKIADAEEKKDKNHELRLWLKRLKDVAYDASDVVDEFSYETLRRTERGSLKYKARDFVSSSNPIAYRRKLIKKIKEVNNRVDELAKAMQKFHLETIPSSTAVAHGESSERRSRQTTSFPSQSQIVGRDDDKSKLINLLTAVTSSSELLSNSDHHLENVHVVSIVGMGGLGKTTLAQLVYNDDTVKQHFEPKIWVCVSDDFNVRRLLSDIMESITRQKFSELSNLDVLVRKVREELTGKRYLLVLDDLWNEDAEQWERLFQSSLILGAQGSKILITTRKRQAADVVKGSIPPYFLQKLQADECWSIMERKAFSPGGALQNPEMTKIGKEIANKCSGLPLAAKFLGSLMHSKNNESNWLSIRENDVWNTPESQSKIIPVLKLSYDNLSPHLQRCFSYCSIFPKDWELSKQTLIQLWMAEGFLQPSNMGGSDCSFEDIGEEYFESLMWSSFFDGVKKNELDDVMTFKMHDLVHDLAQAVVGDHECSIVKVTDQLEKFSEVRRLNLIMDQKPSETFYKTISNNKLRTIIILEPNYDLNLRRLSSDNKRLRILHLGDEAENCSGIRYTTSKLRQLRYFHMSSLSVTSNDYSFSRLYNLQTLVFCGFCPVQNLVEELGSLKQLRHLDISSTDIQELPVSVTSLHNLQSLDLNHCENLTTFPDSITGLENLKFLDMSFTPIEKVPDFVTSLCNLHTLDVNTCTKLKTLPEYVAGISNVRMFNFKNCPLLETLPKDFGVLTQLRYLSLEGCDQISVLPESCSTNLNNLEYVDLGWCALPKEVTKWIKLRKFYYYRMETPKGIGKLIWLQKLMYRVREKVKNEFECNDGIEELGNLNSLEELGICNLQNVKDPIDAENANLKGKQNLRGLVLHWDETEEDLGMRWDQTSCNFQVFEALQPPSGLRELYIYNFMGCDLPTWMCVPSGLPNLERLELYNCRGIKQLPASIGQLPRLRSLKLEGLSLKSLDIEGFPSLLQLRFTDMFLLEELCYSHPCLQDLRIIGCKNLRDIPSFPSLGYLELEKVNPKLVWSVGRSQITSLTKLYLENIGDLIYFPISILQNNRNLQLLIIQKCNQLQGFRVIEDGNENVVAPLLVPDLYSTVSLQTLELLDCPELKFLPDLRGWTSFHKLTIFNCPQVKESLTYDLKSLSFLKQLGVDFIQRDEKRGDPSDLKDLINLMDK